MSAYRPAARAEAHALLEKLSDATSGRVTDEVTLRRLQAEAEGLMNVDVAGSHVVLAGVAALRGDAGAIREHYRIALQHRGAPETFYNYSIALSLVQEAQDAFEAGRTAHVRRPDDVVLLDNVISCALESGHFREAQEYCVRYNALVPQEEHRFTRLAETLVVALDHGSFGEMGVRKVLQILGSVQRSAGLRSAGTVPVPDHDEPHAFLYQRLVYASPTEAAGLNAKLADEIVSHADLMEDPGVLFVPTFVGVDDAWE